MALPEFIEIVPLTAPVRAEITVPGSKSITNRALILAALADGETILRGALWSEDTQIMVECLQELGFMVNVEADPAETCNRTITVYGTGGAVPPGGTEVQPLDLFVGNAGTAARFLAPFLCLGSGVYRLHGVPRMHERPQAALFSALRELGYRVESENGNDKLPVKIFGGGPKPNAECSVSIEKSSQFASALKLCERTGGWKVKVEGENAEESPYVAMTTKLIEAFPNGGEFQIEPDASSGSYFWGVDYLFDRAGFKNYIKVYDWPRTASQWQLDAQFRIWVGLGSNAGMKRTISRVNELADSIMTAIVLAPFAGQPITFTDLGRLRLQECERVVALRTELGKLADYQKKLIIENGDTLTVYPSKLEELHGAEIETYNDHRMAMCFAILALKVPGIKIKNPACVKKTFPNFFQKLAAAPPHGLGAEIWEIKDGQRTRKLSGEDLFAD
jgi:3-phosphoshikimate 1-carboxyvinyltransferase